ncbi:asparagine synthase C-terminal domain-containing protein [Nocardia transvalensis]|uniref:asparagine synthase C-terminal domain-containing protein n=1 Tax=Nocardia transvalensis TaxID=37333 RepID=UPI0012F6D374|nr:asparagine synthase C-terminal domain-containing protein [Nocardia transvalensis]
MADLLDSVAAPDPGARTVTDPRVAAELVAGETRSRVRAVLEHVGGTPVVLLSGGVDSIYVAAVAAELGGAPRAVTVVTDGASDEDHASAAAEALGLRHDIVRLTRDDVIDLARDTIIRLNTSELWEVTAGIPLLAARRVLDAIPDGGAILTGSGADAILAGGRSLSYPLESDSARTELDAMIRAETAANFRRDRLVPDFYPALLEDKASRLVHVFQTVRWWRLAETLAPPALFGTRDDHPIDKLALRLACEAQLPPTAAHLAWSVKDPIQRSTGLMSVLFTAARTYAATLPGADTYTNPLTEDPEAIATRFYLDILGRR